MFIGPSGAGKSTVVRALHRRRVIEVTPSWTTRPRRADEIDGTIEHRFISEAEFTSLERAGYFLEVVRPFGLPFRYGLPGVEPSVVGAVPAIMVRAPLVPLVVRHFPRHVIYQIEASHDRAKERLVRARDADAALGSRLEGFEEERRLGRAIASRCFVNDATVAELLEAVAGAITLDFPEERSDGR